MKIIFVPCSLKKDILPNLKKILIEIKGYKKIGLFSSIQHLNQLQKIKKFLEEENKKVIPGGQILGCSFEKIKKIDKKVDIFLYIGSGKFHPLGIALQTEKPVFLFNPYSNSIGKISKEEKEKYLRKRKAAIAKALEAKKFGILISLKTGQFHFKEAEKIKEKLEKKKGGRKALLFAGDEINPERLLGFKVDVWINTACPRITEDYFDKPLLNMEELKFIL